MKNERILWVLTMLNVVGLMGYYYISTVDEHERLNFLLKTYEVESTIQDATITDITHEISKQSSDSYQKGFEDGKTQSGIAFLHGGTMQDYATGYHAALSQFGTMDVNATPKFVSLDSDTTNAFMKLFHAAIGKGRIEEANFMRSAVMHEMDYTLEAKQKELMHKEETELIRQLERDIQVHDRQLNKDAGTVENKREAKE